MDKTTVKTLAVRVLWVLMQIPGNIVLWRFLYPLLRNIFEQSLESSGYRETFTIIALLGLTFWFFIYANAFFTEVLFEGLYNDFHLSALCAVRWIFFGLINLLLIPFIGVFIWRGLDHYAEVPKWLALSAGIVWGLIFTSRGFSYPKDKINEIVQQINHS